MKDLKDLIIESILDIDRDPQIFCTLQKPKFSFAHKDESGNSEYQYGEIHGEKGDVIGLYEFYDSTRPILILIVNDELLEQWYDENKHETEGWGGPPAKDYISNQCSNQIRKLFGMNIKNDNIYVWNFSDYVDNIEGGAVPFEGEEFDQKILNKWIKWLKFFNKTVKKLSNNSYDLVSDLSEKNWKTYF